MHNRLSETVSAWLHIDAGKSANFTALDAPFSRKKNRNLSGDLRTKRRVCRFSTVGITMASTLTSSQWPRILVFGCNNTRRNYVSPRVVEDPESSHTVQTITKTTIKDLLIFNKRRIVVDYRIPGTRSRSLQTPHYSTTPSSKVEAVNYLLITLLSQWDNCNKNGWRRFPRLVRTAPLLGILHCQLGPVWFPDNGQSPADKYVITDIAFLRSSDTLILPRAYRRNIKYLNGLCCIHRPL